MSFLPSDVPPELAERADSAMRAVGDHMRTAAGMWERAAPGAPYAFLLFDMASPFAQAVVQDIFPPAMRELFTRVNTEAPFGAVLVPLAFAQHVSLSFYGPPLSDLCLRTHLEGHVPTLMALGEGFILGRLVRVPAQTDSAAADPEFRCTAPGGSA